MAELFEATERVAASFAWTRSVRIDALPEPMSRFAILVFVALAGSAFAQAPPPPALEPLPEPPPRVDDPADDPGVRVPVQEGDTIEVIRDGGEVVMVKVTPKEGPPYYLVETAAGSWMRRNSLDDGNRVPMWAIHTFD
jgi:hypothetical protein